MMNKVVAKKGFESELDKGSWLLYTSLVQEVKGEPKKGELVQVIDEKGKFLAQGFFNPSGGISVQVVSLNEKEKVNEDFFREKIRRASEFRTKQLKRSQSFRWFYGEADGIPGLVIDLLGSVASIQISCPGVENYKESITSELLTYEEVKTVVERNDTRNRVKCGMPSQKGVLGGEKKTQTKVLEGKVTYAVDVLRGHKTGFYLDQFENRIAFENYCSKEMNVLDVFSYTGGFGLHALAQGASVTFVDLPETIEQAKKNVELNGWTNRATFIEGDAFEVTKKLLSKPDRFDVISCDPPAFVQKRTELKNGKKAYHQINYNCLKLIKNNGVLASSSCSHFLSEQDFLDVLIAAGANAGKRCQLIERRYQARDHLGNLASKGAQYLKCFFIRVQEKK